MCRAIGEAGPRRRTEANGLKGGLKGAGAAAGRASVSRCWLGVGRMHKRGKDTSFNPWGGGCNRTCGILRRGVHTSEDSGRRRSHNSFTSPSLATRTQAPSTRGELKPSGCGLHRAECVLRRCFRVPTCNSAVEAHRSWAQGGTDSVVLSGRTLSQRHGNALSGCVRVHGVPPALKQEPQPH